MHFAHLFEGTSSCHPGYLARDPKEIVSRVEDKIPILLEPGDLILLSGEARYKWTHEINRGEESQVWNGERITQSKRISITLRKLVIQNEGEWCRPSKKGHLTINAMYYYFRGQLYAYFAVNQSKVSHIVGKNLLSTVDGRICLITPQSYFAFLTFVWHYSSWGLVHRRKTKALMTWIQQYVDHMFWPPKSIVCWVTCSDHHWVTSLKIGMDLSNINKWSNMCKFCILLKTKLMALWAIHCYHLYQNILIHHR